MKLTKLTKALVGAGLALAAGSAFAMPAQLAALTAMEIFQLVMVAFSVVSTIVNTDQARRSAHHKADDAKRAYNAGLQDRSITALQSIPAWDVVYGRCIKGGSVRAIFTSDKTGTNSDGTTYTKPDAYKHLVISFANHECLALNEVYLDGTPINLASLDGSGWVTGGEFATSASGGASREVSLAIGGSYTTPYPMTVVSSIVTPTNLGDIQYVAATYALSNGNKTITNTSGSPSSVSVTFDDVNSYVRCSYHLGAAGQTVDTYLASVAPEWLSTATGQGIAYAVITLDLTNQRFTGGPPNVTFDVTGKLLYDPRTMLTTYSNNPALCARDFLLGEYGYDCSASEVDDTYVIAAANACDAAVSLVNNSGATIASQKTFTCDGSFTTNDSKESVFREIVATMCGTATYGATWALQAGAWTASVMDLLDDDLLGQIEVVQGSTGLDDLYNAIRGTFIAEGQATPSDFGEYSNSTYVTADGGVKLYDDITLPFTTWKSRARNIARIRTEQIRSGLIITYPAKLKAWPLRVGDRVRVTSAEYGWSLKYFRVTDWQFTIAGAVQLMLREDFAAIYDMADAPTANVEAPTNLPNPWLLGQLSGLAADSSNSVQTGGDTLNYRALVSWTRTTDAYMTNGRIRVSWRRVAVDAPNAFRVVEVPGNDNKAFLLGVAPGDLIMIGVQQVNELGAVGPSKWLFHVVTATAFAGFNSDLSLVGVGVNIDGSTVTKIVNNGQWDASVYSKDGFTGGAYCSFAPQRTDDFIMVGLNSDPQPGDTYTTLDYAIYCNGDGTLIVYESSTATGAIDTYAAGDVLSVVYDGVNVKYMKNGTVFKTTAAAAGQKLFLDSSFYSGSVAKVRFGPLSAVTGIGTGQINANAATEYAQDLHDFAGATFGNADAYTFSFTPTVDCWVEFTATLEGQGMEGDGGAGFTWRLTPALVGGDPYTVIGGSNSNTLARQTFPGVNGWAATGGVAQTITIRTAKGGYASVALFKSSILIAMIKR